MALHNIHNTSIELLAPLQLGPYQRYVTANILEVDPGTVGLAAKSIKKWGILDSKVNKVPSHVSV